MCIFHRNHLESSFGNETDFQKKLTEIFTITVFSLPCSSNNFFFFHLVIILIQQSVLTLIIITFSLSFLTYFYLLLLPSRCDQSEFKKLPVIFFLTTYLGYPS